MSERVLFRAVDADWHADGRILEGRVMPYGVTADVMDGMNGTRYRERFEPGAFSGAVRAPDRVVLRFEHMDGLAELVGRAESLTESADWLTGAFRVVASPFGDHALALVNDGTLRGLSVGFRPLSRGRIEEDGTLVRTKCHLEEVSLTRSPAYAGAEIMAVRHRPDLVELRPERDERMDQRLRALGYGSTIPSQ